MLKRRGDDPLERFVPTALEKGRFAHLVGDQCLLASVAWAATVIEIQLGR